MSLADELRNKSWICSPIESTVKAPPVHNKHQASLKRQQTETKKQKLSKMNKTSTIRKKAKTSKARTPNVRHVPSDENDVRNKPPESFRNYQDHPVHSDSTCIGNVTIRGNWLQQSSLNQIGAFKTTASLSSIVAKLRFGIEVVFPSFGPRYSRT